MLFRDTSHPLLFPFVFMLLFSEIRGRWRFMSAVCHSEHVTSFWPFQGHFQARQMARHQSSEMASGLSALAVHHPLAVTTADQFAHYAAQKHHQHPCQPSDAAYYLEHANHKSVAEHKEQCKYLHTTSFSFFKDTQIPRDCQAPGSLSPASSRLIRCSFPFAVIHHYTITIKF